MSHLLFRRVALSLVAASGLVLAPTTQLAAVVDTSDTENPWQPRRSPLSLSSADDDYATDHVLVKRVGSPVEIVSIDTSVSEALEYWAQQDDVEYVEPDALYRALGQETSWGWTTVKAGDAATTNSVTGSGVIVAVVDTGVDYAHEDLDANNWVNTGETAGNGVDDDGNGYVDDYYGYDFIGSFYTSVDPDTDPQDEYGHGTHVSGIIAAENNTVGTRGIAPSAQIMPVKVLDSVGVGFDSTVADGIRYAVDNGADVINLSLGSQYPSNTLKAAIDYAATNNVLVVAASGNESTFSAPSYPAAYSSVISVGATTEEGYKVEWSNWGKVDVMAPGVDIVSTIPGNLYDSMSGTSMASPHVAGVAALTMQKFATTDARTVRHIMQLTADDFGLISGHDYVSGSGMVNALDTTGTQAAGSYAFADTGFLLTDGSSDAVVTVSVRTAGNVAVAGETVTWTTTAGTLSAASSTTNASGEASVTLTADDVAGLVTVTGTPTNYTASSIQLALLDDIVYPESVGVSAYTAGEDTASEDEIIIAAASDISANLFSAGDKLTVWAHPTGFDRETHNIAVSYAVTDANGDAISGMSGTMPTTEAGAPIWVWYLPQVTVESNPVKIPKTAEDGEYTVTVTVTDTDTSESSSASSNFWVGELPEVLVIDDDGYCYDTPVEGLDFGYIAYCASAGQTVANAFNDAGRETMLWNVTKHGYPSSTDLALFPLVVMVDSTFSYTDTATLTSYLDAGGNLLITSEQLAYNTTYGAAPTDFLWNYLHVNYASSVSQPGNVIGFTGSDFDGDSYNIDTYNIAGDGVQTMYIGDELQLDSTNDDVEALFSYSRGETDDKVAGVRVANSDYRVVYLTFGLESVNDSGTATKATLVDELADWLLGDAPTITKVSAKKFNNNRAQTITIRGTNFQMTGETVVKLRKLALSDVVVQSRKKITATIPAGLSPRSYSLKVIRPDGRKVTKGKAVTISNGDIFIDSLSTSFASNNTERELTVTGGGFHQNAKVWFGNNRISDVTWNGTTSLTVTIPAGFDPGQYTVKVKNPNGSRATRAGFTVRVGFTETLAVGDTHAQVEALEKRLSTAGYFTEEADTTFDSVTEEALVRYQTDNFLQVTGKVDANTRYYLNNN